MRFGIVVAEWNPRGHRSPARAAPCGRSAAAGCPDLNIQIKYVPGTFELALGAQFFAEYTDVDAVIALGCVIQGDTRHFDFVCQGVTQGVTQLQIAVEHAHRLRRADRRTTCSRRSDRCGRPARATRATKPPPRPSIWSNCRSRWKPLRRTTNPTGGISTDRQRCRYMKNGELYDSPFFSFSGGRIRSCGLCICLPSALSACIGLCLPSALFVCVCLCLCQVCLSAAPCLRVCLPSALSVCGGLSVFCPIPLSGALCAPSSGGRNGRWRRLRSRGPMLKGGP